MTEAEIKAKNYTHCTIDSGEYGKFLAKVEYKDYAKAWGPTEVFIDGVWVQIDDFDDMDGYNCYECSDYRINDTIHGDDSFICIEEEDGGRCLVQCPYCERI